MLITIPDVLNAEQLHDCRQALEQAQWEDGRTTAGYLAQHSKRNLQLPLETTVARQMGEFLMHVLGQHSGFIAAALPLRMLPPRFNRYEGGGEYGNHIDNAIFTVPGTGQRLRTDVSSTLFFSDRSRNWGSKARCLHSGGGARPWWSGREACGISDTPARACAAFSNLPFAWQYARTASW